MKQVTKLLVGSWNQVTVRRRTYSAVEYTFPAALDAPPVDAQTMAAASWQEMAGGMMDRETSSAEDGMSHTD